jgi:predicted SprT family Zn-dependent metalloprotease
LPTGCKQGEYVTGHINLSFPLCTDILPDDIIASMTHEWAIKHIVADLTRYRPGDETNSWLVRDEQRVAYEEVKSTSGKMAHSYILQCEQKQLVE